ncbi:tRNA (adenosine(37)-N6)-threonylcarbamoyltransferase complex ATPase subunit type 1 TsaE [Candidatus Uhrbacteria bacterium]|nr:tRNA (adenosine(37)-N6)-threonylcarbamoyltransferase complex ATPase subunit type 1 TsaE [Candidatus Uhrbacteria bacterium]
MNTRTITVVRSRAREVMKSRSPEDTYKIAKTFGRTLRGGDVIALSGELGAGKTAFAKGIAAALGIKATVTSPTFVLMMRYGIPQKNHRKCNASFLYHIDTYRLATLHTLAQAGIAEYIGIPDAITIIEWPEKIRTLLPRTTIDVSLAVPKVI